MAIVFSPGVCLLGFIIWFIIYMITPTKNGEPKKSKPRKAPPVLTDSDELPPLDFGDSDS